MRWEKYEKPTKLLKGYEIKEISHFLESLRSKGYGGGKFKKNEAKKGGNGIVEQTFQWFLFSHFHFLVLTKLL